MQRWGEWTSECFRKHKDQLIPKIEHIHDLEWGKEETQVEEDLRTTRQKAAIAKIIQEEPETETWLNQEYAEQVIGQ